MKYEQAIQQVMSEYNRHQLTDSGECHVSDFDGYGEVVMKFRQFERAIEFGGKKPECRKAAKELAAMALRFMVDRT